MPYAPRREVTDPGSCYFYHSVELPGHGVFTGEWDLRGRVEAYLGGVDLRGKRVLELGTANGFLCFEMERLGAEVVAFDLDERHDWDVVPYDGAVDPIWVASRRTHIRAINDAWWLTWRLSQSRARVVYGTVYEVPNEVGPVDISTFGCILLHLRDPFRALHRAAELTRETIVVTDVVPGFLDAETSSFEPPAPGQPPILDGRSLPELTFLPDPATRQPPETWWLLSPALVARWLRILGFSEVTTTYHPECYSHGRIWLYTVVGRRGAARLGEEVDTSPR
jgi:hypothetical protein